MIALVKMLLTAELLALSLVHVLWAIGFWWPLRDEKELARAFVGARGIEKMPGAVPSALVATALLAAAWWPWGAVDLGPVVYGLGLVTISAVFALRGIAPWLPAWRRKLPESPFAEYDRRYFGPLCILLALGFAIVASSSL